MDDPNKTIFLARRRIDSVTVETEYGTFTVPNISKKEIIGWMALYGSEEAAIANGAEEKDIEELIVENLPTS